MKQTLLFLFIISLSNTSYAHAEANSFPSGLNEAILLNQLCYYSYGPKIAIITQSKVSKFTLLAKNKAVFTGNLKGDDHKQDKK